MLRIKKGQMVRIPEADCNLAQGPVSVQGTSLNNNGFYRALSGDNGAHLEANALHCKKRML
ncbi:hypothetical protein J6590_010181 [Homalodisca vitripennis]|nr:hypothetical protein J6590_010181 [Homalodisca vitripennis]